MTRVLSIATTIAKKEKVSIKANAVKQVPYNFSNSSGFLEAATKNCPNNTPVPKAPKLIGRKHNPIKMSFVHLIKII